jgi:hypothetical protein
MYPSVELDTLILTVISESETPVERQKIEQSIYLIDRHSVSETGKSLTDCTYTKYERGPHNNMIEKAISQLVKDDLLYSEVISETETAQTVLSVDYRTRFESEVEAVPQEIQEVVMTVCERLSNRGVKETKQIMHSLPEVKDIEKYGTIPLSEIR